MCLELGLVTPYIYILVLLNFVKTIFVLLTMRFKNLFKLIPYS